jgi:hypothetical protein
LFLVGRLYGHDSSGSFAAIRELGFMTWTGILLLLNTGGTNALDAIE